MTTARSSSVLGRDAELGRIDAFLDDVGLHGAATLLLSGSAGIGKTTLWTAGLAAARGRGLRVVSARPTEVETGLSFAALGDLLGPLLVDTLSKLPEPQREALDAALLRAPAGTTPHPLGVSLATLAVLRAASESGPLLVAVDDAPWLDDASARAIEFALRRLTSEPVGFLVARRAATADEPLPGWVASAPPERFDRVDVGPLSIDAVGALLRDRLGLTLRRPILARLHAISGGTPFYALELGRDLAARGSPSTRDALDAPRALDRLVGARIGALEPDAEAVAVHASALAQPTIGLLEASLGRTAADAGLASAVAAGVLETSGDAVRFSHPLLAAAAYQRARPDHRRALHAHLATVVSDPEERARHLARSADGADETVAAALELAADAAIRRGASGVAAELAEEAARLTPTTERSARDRRLLATAEHLAASGDIHRADEVLASLSAELPATPIHADVLTRRARIALYLTDAATASRLLHEALPMAAGDPRARIEIHALLAGVGYLSWRDWRHARFEMWTALRLARAAGEPAHRIQILGHAATWLFGLAKP